MLASYWNSDQVFRARIWNEDTKWRRRIGISVFLIKVDESSSRWNCLCSFLGRKIVLQAPKVDFMFEKTLSRQNWTTWMRWEKLNHSRRKNFKAFNAILLFSWWKALRGVCSHSWGMWRADEVGVWHRHKVQGVKHQPVRLEFAFFISAFQLIFREGDKQHLCMLGMLVVGCTLEDWSRSAGRTGSVSTDVSHAQIPGANQ